MRETTEPRRRNVGKLLARLNPKSMRLMAGAGGGAADSAIDIAGALGAAGQGRASHRLAVHVLCLRWWPAVFDAPPRTVAHETVKCRNVVTYRRNPRVIEYEVRQPVVASGETQAFREVVGLLEHRIERSILRDQYRAQRRLGDELWAWLTGCRRPPAAEHGPSCGPPLEEGLTRRVLAPAFLGAWARLVIHEYRHPNHCQSCTQWGRAGEVPRFEGLGEKAKLEWVTCPTCLGAGLLSWSSKRRAAALSIGEHPFRNYLKPHHDGALTLLRELEWRGARLFLRRLGGI